MGEETHTGKREIEIVNEKCVFTVSTKKNISMMKMKQNTLHEKALVVAVEAIRLITTLKTVHHPKIVVTIFDHTLKRTWTM